jgi:catechol 2,3-dioxygenase-like lactoylglutathione lyase family enzyme
MIKFIVSLLSALSLIACKQNKQGNESSINTTAATNLKIISKMKLNAGIVTSKLAETKKFYSEVLNFGVTFENEFYLLLHTPDREAEISFLLPNHPSQQSLFQKPFMGQGMYLTIEVDDVDKVYSELKQKAVEIKIDIRDEPWGDRHFAIQDPNGIGIDIVKYSPQN